MKAEKAAGTKVLGGMRVVWSPGTHVDTDAEVGKLTLT